MATSSISVGNLQIQQIEAQLRSLQSPFSTSETTIINVICPSHEVSLWLKDALQQATSHLNPKPLYRFWEFETWLPNIVIEPMEQAPTPEQQQSLKCFLQTLETPTILYGPAFFPEWFQTLMAELWQSDAQKASLIQAITPMPILTGKTLAMAQDTYRSEQSMSREIYRALRQGTSLSEVVVLCADTSHESVWRKKLSQLGIPIWGEMAPETRQAVESLYWMLQWLHEIQKANLQSFHQSFQHAKCQAIFQTLLKHQGLSVSIPDFSVETLLQNPDLLPAASGLRGFFNAYQHQADSVALLKATFKNPLFKSAPQSFWQLILAKLETLVSATETERDLGQLARSLYTPETSLSNKPFLNTDQPGLKVLSFDKAVGISASIAFLPEIHLLLETHGTKTDWARLTEALSLYQHVFATIDNASLNRVNLANAQDWLSDWTMIQPEASRKQQTWNLTFNDASEWLQEAFESSEIGMGQKTLSMTPSSIETFLQCPRKFFYQSVLQLRDDRTSPQAAFGSLVHRILERFNQHFQDSYTYENLIKLTDIFFMEPPDIQALQALGCQPKDREMLDALSPLHRFQVERDVRAAFQALQESGYFASPFKRLLVEEKLTFQGTGPLEGLSLYGRSDLIRELPQGAFEIVDYKTSRSKYKHAHDEKNLQPLLNALEPVDWDEPDLYQRYYGRELQLPLYWMMLQQSAEFNPPETHASIQVVRAPSTFVKLAGAMTLTLPHQTIEAGRANLIDLLQEGILKPIRSIAHFAPLGNPQAHCGYCPYTNMCEGPDTEDEEDDED